MARDPHTDVSAAEAMERTAKLRDVGTTPSRILTVTLEALWSVEKGDSEEVALGPAEVRALLNSFGALRRQAESARIDMEHEKARDARQRANQRADIEKWIKQGQEMLGRLE